MSTEPPYPRDIYTEPAEVDPDTLRNLGPLRALAGTWEGVRGHDDHPAEAGAEQDVYVERIELQPIDPQMNGPQVLYGLRYHVHIVKPDEVETFHDQVGYWLWEPATRTVIHTLTIPRGQVVMAGGTAAPDATIFEVSAKLGSETYGICSAPFLAHAFRTIEFHMRVQIDPCGTWSYEEDTVMQVRGRAEPFHHRDHNTLTKVAEPQLNPLMLEAREQVA